MIWLGGGETVLLAAWRLARATGCAVYYPLDDTDGRAIAWGQHERPSLATHATHFAEQWMGVGPSGRWWMLTFERRGLHFAWGGNVARRRRVRVRCD